MDSGLKITNSTKQVLQVAEQSAVSTYGSQITTLNILYGLTSVASGVACSILQAYGISADKMYSYLNNATIPTFASGIIDFSQGATAVISMAGIVAKELRAGCVSTEHLLFALLSNPDCDACKVIECEFLASLEDMKEKMLSLFKENISSSEDEEPLEVEESEGVDGSQIFVGIDLKPLPSELSSLGTDLTLRAKQGKIGEVIGREKEIERVVEILCRKTKNNPILIGDAGVGKSAVAECLALKIVSGEVPEILRHKRIFSLELGSLLAGTKYRGAMEEKLKSAIDVIMRDGDIIVFIDEIHTLIEASGEKGEVSPADMLKPYLARGELQTIGATTVDEYRKFIEKDKALERRFQPVMIEAPSTEDSIKILKGIKQSFETYHNVEITDEAITSAVELSERYITDRNLPDKAIDLIDEASSRARVRRSGDDVPKILQGDIEEVVSKWTGVPVNKLSEGEKERLVGLEDLIHKRVIGQDEAVREVCRALRRSRIGIADTKKPIGSFLFLGQTGVGKTELSKAIAEGVFGSEKSLIRIDMSEFMESHSVAKLIGSPPGYVGYDEGGQLTDAVRKRPYSVVLFDEIEKAHGDVLNLLLQLLDDGRLTDSKGRLVNFKNCIIIATSNLGADKINNQVDSSFAESVDSEKVYEHNKQIMLEEVKRRLKAELVNRFDSIVVFRKLNKGEMARIAMILINNLNNRLQSQELWLKLDESALRVIVENGSDYNMGARPLKRFIQREIEDKLADEILKGNFKSGGEIVVHGENNVLTFQQI